MKEILSKKLKARINNIKIFACDVDGTLTDGCVYYSKYGEELKKFSLRDGRGAFLLKEKDIEVGIITTENSEIVKRRAEKLGLDFCFLGITDKLSCIQDYLRLKHLELENVAFIGDDTNDLDVLIKCGVSFAVSDANESLLNVVDVICMNKGGEGAFREAVNLVIGVKDEKN